MWKVLSKVKKNIPPPAGRSKSVRRPPREPGVALGVKMAVNKVGKNSIGLR
jgi:hypothetical protein|tara:strand:- start:204 stop:356 length:153 start_codon:yes stop_codon:yes gene_type:complete